MQSRGTKMLIRNFAGGGALMLLAAGLAGCAAPQYDSQTDQLITTAQTDTDTLLVHLSSLDDQIAARQQPGTMPDPAALKTLQSEAAYAANIPAYDKIQVDLIALQTRIDAEPNSSTPHLDNALKELNANLFGPGSLQAYHQSQNILGKTVIDADQKLIDEQYSALLLYELVLKTGGKT